jgi:hypothetical protein
MNAFDAATYVDAMLPADQPEPFIGTVSHTGCLNIYRLHSISHCPGCGNSQWFVGRITAGCAVCNTVIPLADVDIAPARTKSPAELEARTIKGVE